MDKTTQSFAMSEFEVIHWADNVGILKHGTIEGQLKKLAEECGELGDALTANDMPEIADAVGDIVIVLLMICALKDLDLRQCLYDAAKIVTKRKGEMRSDGIFYKEK